MGANPEAAVRLSFRDNIVIGTDVTAEVNDQQPEQAIEHARALLESGQYSFEMAQLNRLHGLYVRAIDNDGCVILFHYRTPLCGYRGTEPDAAAEIIELLGFCRPGRRSAVIDIISRSWTYTSSTTYTFLPFPPSEAGGRRRFGFRRSATR